MALDSTNLEYMIRAAGGKAVTFGTEATWALVDHPSEELFGPDAPVLATDRFLTVATGALTAGKGDILTVERAEYEVHQPPRKIDDGELTRYWIREP